MNAARVLVCFPQVTVNNSEKWCIFPKLEECKKMLRKLGPSFIAEFFFLHFARNPLFRLKRKNKDSESLF